VSAAPGSGSNSGGGTFTPLLLAVLVMISAVAVVQIKQHNRNLTTRLDGMRQERDELARRQFDMVDPLDYQIVPEDSAAAAGKPQ